MNVYLEKPIGTRLHDKEYSPNTAAQSYCVMCLTAGDLRKEVAGSVKEMADFPNLC